MTLQDFQKMILWCRQPCHEVFGPEKGELFFKKMTLEKAADLWWGGDGLPLTKG